MEYNTFWFNLKITWRCFAKGQAAHTHNAFMTTKNRTSLVNIPVATVIGGGYSSDTEELASRHAIIFNVAARIYKIL